MYFKMLLHSLSTKKSCRQLYNSHRFWTSEIYIANHYNVTSTVTIDINRVQKAQKLSNHNANVHYENTGYGL